MTKLEQAARQALGALEVATTPLAKDRQEVLRAITTLREALSEVQALSAAPVDAQLLQFYGVSTDAELISAQARHIEKLQAKLSPTPSFAPQRVREG